MTSYSRTRWRHDPWFFQHVFRPPHLRRHLMPSHAASQDIDSSTKATLRMLEWSSICEALGTFSSTLYGRKQCLELGSRIPSTLSETERLLDETRAAMILEMEYSTTLDFGGIDTSGGESALMRAGKGGMCSPSELKGAVSIFEGASALRRQVLGASRSNESNLQPSSIPTSVKKTKGKRPANESAIAPLLKAVSSLPPFVPSFCREVKVAIDDEGRIVDAASDILAALRSKIRTLESRLGSILRGYQLGEASTQSGRMCIAMLSGIKAPTGSMLLGSAPGGSIVYVEPPGVVPLNNELGAARAMAESAEDDVLQDLTGRLMGVLIEGEQSLEVIGLLDVLAAKVRYGAWLGGELPEVVGWDSIFHSRGWSASSRRNSNSQEIIQSEETDEDFTGYMVQLRNFRHPLLHGNYLKRKQVLERQVWSKGGSIDNTGSPDAPARKGQRRQLPSRRQTMLRGSGLDSSLRPSGGVEDQTSAALLSSLRPPRPVDVLIRKETHVLVVTGPNTGGKTASAKALGLASLMARSGLLIPADAPARIPLFSMVLADIGDEQSLTANLSTFSGHLKRIQALRSEADGKALIILDELGTGTDPSEGAALGVALLRKMVNGGQGNGALVIATTHHSIMTGLKFEDAKGRFENASVEFDEVALSPTYKLLWGIPGRSNALNIAERLGLDPQVVVSARSRLDTSVAAADVAISRLEDSRALAEREETGLWAADQEVRKLSRVLSSFQRKVEVKKEELGRARLNSLFEIWQGAKERLSVVRDLRKKYRQGKLSGKSSALFLDLIQQGSGSKSKVAKVNASEVLEAVGKLVDATPEASPASMTDVSAVETPIHDTPPVLPAGETLMGPKIEDYVSAEVDELFDEIANKFEIRMERQRRQDEGSLDQVVDSLELLLEKGMELDRVEKSLEEKKRQIKMEVSRVNKEKRKAEEEDARLADEIERLTPREEDKKPNQVHIASEVSAPPQEEAEDDLAREIALLEDC